MSLERWEKMKLIFEAALAKTPDELPKFLDLACSGDQTLRLQLARLVASYTAGESFFEHPPSISAAHSAFGKFESPLLSYGQMVCDRFLIGEFLGGGGMGEVYSARDIELKQDIALKILNSGIASDPISMHRFIREVQLSRKVTHPNVCRIFDIAKHRVNSDREFPVLTMQLLKGETLAHYLQTVGRIELDNVLPVVDQMCLALEAAHKEGIIHRDFKPSNIMVERSSGHVHVVVTDFGLACLTGDEPDSTNLTVTGGIVGTPDYMAPEQLSNDEVTAQSDIYALGLVIFELVTGEKPFRGTSAMTRAVMRLSNEPRRPRELICELPQHWENAILRCLERSPSDRFRSAGEVIESFRSETDERRPSLKKLGAPLKRKLPLFGILAVILALFVSGLRFLNRNAAVPPGSRVLVTEIETSEPDLQGVTAAFKSQLSQSEHFELVAEDRVPGLLTQMGATSQNLSDVVKIRELALRAGAQTAVYGSVSKLGGEYVFDVKVELVGSGPTLIRHSWKNQFTARDKQDLFDAVHRAAVWVRQIAGEPAQEMAEQNRTTQDTTTSSWPALQLFASARERSAAGDDHAAVLLLREALEADPDFAAAHMRLADLLISINNYSEGYEHWRRAMELTNKRELTSRENLRIKGQYFEDTGDLRKAEQAYREFAFHYPHDPTPLLYLGSVLDETNQDDEAIRTFQKAAAMQPDYLVAPQHLGMIYLYQGDYKAAQIQIRRLEVNGNKEWATVLQGMSQFLQGRPREALDTISTLEGSHSEEWKSRKWTYETSLLGELGEYRAALSATRAGIAFDSSHGFTLSEADKYVQLANILRRDGQVREAREAALRAIDLDNGPNHLLAAGIVLARSGDTSHATNLMKALSREPDVPRIRFAKHRLNGEIALADHRPSDAVLEFQKASKLQSLKANREYLARALQMAGEEEAAIQIRKDMYDHPALFWVYEPGELPGLWADSLYNYITLESKINRGEACALRSNYIAMRSSSESKQVLSEIMLLPGRDCQLQGGSN